MNHSLITKTSFAILVLVTLMGAGEEGVRGRVADGIRKYRDSDFAGAAKEFADADLLVPDNPFIQFNRGCAESHDEENRDGARLFFRSAAMARDTTVAVAAHYNLGCLEAREARGLFDGYAEGLRGKDRKKAVAALNKSIDHFRDCLRIDPGHQRSKRNIEIIKLFLADVQKKWDDQERKEPPEQQPPEEPLVRLLDKLDVDQHRSVQLTTTSINDPASVRASTCQSMQVKVNNQIPQLREKLETQFQADTSDQRQKQAIAQIAATFGRKTDEFEKHAQAALKNLASEKLEAAVPEQHAALEPLNQMYEMLAQFPDLVFRSLRIQQATQQLTRLNTNTQKFNPQAGLLTPIEQLSERQGRVAAMAKLLPTRAGQFETVLKQAEQQAAQSQGAQPPGGMTPQAIAGYRTALERAGELGPELIDVTGEAGQLLESEEQGKAIPKQERAFEILAKIAETMPRPPQENQQNENENKQDPDNEKDDEPNADEDRGETDPNQQQQPEQRKQREEQIRSREQAEAMLRKVHDREQAHRDKKARLRASARRAHVERDW